MRARKNDLMALNTSLIFNSIEEAKKMARYIIDCSISVGKKLNIPYKLLVGISENNSRFGRIVTEKNGKPGRPKYVFKEMLSSKLYGVKQYEYRVAPHVHTVFYANGSTAFGLELCKRINKRYKKTIAKIKKCYDNGFISYIYKQSISIRTACYDDDNILNFDFKEIKSTYA